MLSLILAALIQTTPAVTDLSYGETYGCHLLGKVSYEQMYEGGASPVTTSEVAMATALKEIADKAEAALPAAQARDGYADSMVEGARNAAREGLAEASEDQLGHALETCAAIFGVADPG